MGIQEVSILGVDIFKKAIDICLHVIAKERHKVYHNNEEGFNRPYGNGVRIKEHLVPHVCLKATGYYGEDLAIYIYHK